VEWEKNADLSLYHFKFSKLKTSFFILHPQTKMECRPLHIGVQFEDFFTPRASSLSQPSSNKTKDTLFPLSREYHHGHGYVS
jgi:hypothetical protein